MQLVKPYLKQHNKYTAINMIDKKIAVPLNVKEIVSVLAVSSC